MNVGTAIVGDAINRLFPFMYVDWSYTERHMMEVIGIVMVVFGSLITIVLIAALTLVAIVWGRRGNQLGQAEESEMIQEIYHGLARMGDRVETLETLLLEREKHRQV